MALTPLYKREYACIEKKIGNQAVAEISEDGLSDLLSKAREIQNQLCSIPVEERLIVIEKIGRAWTEKHRKGELEGLKNELSTSTGYGPKMIDMEFSLVPAALSALSIKQNLRSSFPFEISCLERFTAVGSNEYCWYRPRGPVFIISSGNSLIPPLIPTTISLATGNMTLLRPSLANFLGVKAVYSLLEGISGDVAELMREALAISYFSHDSTSLEYLLTKSKVGVVNFWGGEPARTEISRRVSSNPHHPTLIINGPLTGYAIVDAASAGESSALALARNILLYDQQLCSSPTEGAFVGSWEEAVEFATLVGKKLDELTEILPPKVTESYAYVIEGMRRSLQFKGSMVFKSESSPSWTLALSKSRSILDDALRAFPEFGLHTRRRFMEIIVVEKYEDAIKMIEGLPKRKSFGGIDGVQSVGLSVSDDVRERLCTGLAERGIFRILPLEDMYMRSPLEPYDGMNLAQAFTYAVYRRDRPLEA
ncbi:MAG: acyl-CoA reductase [Candidatus Methanosuratincola sp.]